MTMVKWHGRTIVSSSDILAALSPAFFRWRKQNRINDSPSDLVNETKAFQVKEKTESESTNNDSQDLSVDALLCCVRFCSPFPEEKSPRLPIPGHPLSLALFLVWSVYFICLLGDLLLQNQITLDLPAKIQIQINVSSYLIFHLVFACYL